MKMMLVKELLHDLVHNKLDIDSRVVLVSAIEHIYKSGVCTKKDILLLDLYLCGYSAEEIAMQSVLSTEVVISILARVITAIEHTSGYLDDLFLQRAAQTHTPRQIKYAREYIEQHNKDFIHI